MFHCAKTAFGVKKENGALMKIYRQGNLLDIHDKIKDAEHRLKNNNVYTLDSIDHTDHIAAYIAWQNVGGNIFVKFPALPEEQQCVIDRKIQDYRYKDSICFHTSGTTGVPKLVVHHKKQIDLMRKMADIAINWDVNTKFLNFFPPATSGFWHIVLPSFVYHNSSLALGSRETVIQDLEGDHNKTILVPAMIDQIRISGKPVDFSNYELIGSGASAVLSRHSSFLLKNNVQEFVQIYGTTEISAPGLFRKTKHIDDYIEYVDITSNPLQEFKLENNELLVRGPGLCSNVEEFNYVDGWLRTNDIWEQKDNLIHYIGRNNDIVKVNGYKVSLLQVEQLTEEKCNLGDTLAVVRNSLGSDWIELFYTNNIEIDKSKIHKQLSQYIVEYNIPRKYTLVNSLPRTAMGKKIRNAI
jgi:acyl-coenzyme A synthetase/AMP-(fatty) acid ligase